MRYYSRQMLLPEVGAEGQEKLGKARVLVIGAGGLGSPVLTYLASAGVGVIGICDGDTLDESNLHRQPLYSAKDVGRPKVELARERLAELNPYIEIQTYYFRLSADYATLLFSQYDIILDCTDNFKAKFLINDAAFLTKKPVVRSSIYQFEGQIQTYLPERGDACLRCLWPETPQEGCVGTCAQVGVLGPVPGFFGVLQAIEAIKWILSLSTLDSILLISLLDYSQQIISSEKNPHCPLCGENPIHKTVIDKEEWELYPADLQKAPYQLVDIREQSETDLDPYSKEALLMPLSCFNVKELDEKVSYAIFCLSGKRSFSLVQTLRNQGVMNIYALIGGIEGLAKNNYIVKDEDREPT